MSKNHRLRRERKTPVKTRVALAGASLVSAIVSAPLIFFFGVALGTSIQDEGLLRFYFAAIFVMLWTAAPLFLGPVERLLVQWHYGAELVEQSSYAEVTTAATNIATLLQVDLSSIDLYVAEDEILNAYAFGYRSVVLTEPATELSLEELEAVISHEIGHLLERHSVGLAASIWYSWPNLLLIQFFEYMKDVNSRNGLQIALQTIFGLPYWGSLLLRWKAMRQAEFVADEVVRRCGRGEQLATLFESAEAEDAPVERIGALPIKIETHPQIATRIARLRA